jgi:predicted amidophosphoribosyltransferase
VLAGQIDAGQMGASQLGAGQLGSGLPGAGRERPIWLIPAPSSRASLKTRGFVPAKLLASAVARELRVSGLAGVKVIDCLRISGNTRDQAGLGKTERFENLRGKIAASPKWFNLPASRPTLVLIDDIVTTGATLLEMQRSLSEVGLPAEFFATFAETL